jgi:hypothetical protein
MGDCSEETPDGLCYGYTRILRYRGRGSIVALRYFRPSNHVPSIIDHGTLEHVYQTIPNILHVIFYVPPSQEQSSLDSLYQNSLLEKTLFVPLL